MRNAALSDLNFHHLKYLLAVAEEGSVSAASRALGVAQPTISAQLRQFQDDLGQELLERSGRGVMLTEAGHTVAEYAREIFTLGDDLLATVRGGGVRQRRLVVGMADAIPKQVAWRVIEPALELDPPVQVSVEQDKPERLLAELSQGKLDLVLADAPLAPNSRIQAYSHRLAECGVLILASPELAANYQEDFPRCLDGAPLVLPSDDTTLYHQLLRWFQRRGITPRVVAEIEDPSLMKRAAQAGVGIIAAPIIIQDDAIDHYGLVSLGIANGVRERVYLLSLERRLQHPAVVAISTAARVAFAAW